MTFMRVLVINPIFTRLKALGALEQDCLANIDDLTRLGHAIHVLTQSGRLYPPQDNEAYYAQRGISARIVPHRVRRLSLHRLRDLAFLDGAAWEHGVDYYRHALHETLTRFSPDMVWCNGSYLWPAALGAHHRGIPTVIRSLNYESKHVLQEEGRTPANWIRYLGKEIGERRAASLASVLAAITPDEQRLYQKIAPQADVRVLPLQTLPRLLRPAHPVSDRLPLRVFSMGASYNVPHNRAALEFVVREVVPKVRALAPGQFEFHVMGSKVPHQFRAFAAPDLIFDDYVEDLETHLSSMDIALAPSRFGQGMKQKLFEPLCRGFPTITSRRALAGYPFEDGTSVLLADDADGVATQLMRLRDPGLRGQLAAGAAQQARALFDQAELDAIRASILAAARG
jgi:glycosyltransferase involved in cell wall biosynthesis